MCVETRVGVGGISWVVGVAQVLEQETAGRVFRGLEVIIISFRQSAFSI